MTWTVDGSIAINDRIDTRHMSVTPAELQIAAASLSTPVTTAFEMPGVAATTSVSDEGTSFRDGAEGGRVALSIIGPLDLQLNIDIKASQIMDW